MATLPVETTVAYKCHFSNTCWLSGIATWHTGTVDPRIARTRCSLQDALFALAKERGIDQVTVSDIADRAGVNRSTFYQHYADKETLLADALDLVADRAYARLKDGLEFTVEPPAVLVEFLGHIDDHAVLYRSVFTEPGWGLVLTRLRGHIRDAVAEVASGDDYAATLGVPLEVLAAGTAGSIVGVIGEWLTRDPLPAADVAAGWVWRVVLGPPAPGQTD